MFCKKCGKEISEEAQACPDCGQPTGIGAVSPKSKTTAAVLCFFFGALGVHRFYVGKVGTGILQLFTLGLVGIWALIDLITILCGSFKDKQGRVLSQ